MQAEWEKKVKLEKEMTLKLMRLDAKRYIVKIKEDGVVQILQKSEEISNTKLCT